MATLPSHALVGASLLWIAGQEKERRAFATAAAFLAMLPDADVVGFKFGVAYAADWGHRGASHSLLFSVLAALPLALWIGRRLPWLEKLRAWTLLALAGVSHGLLDGLTNGGLGIAYFWPWNSSRYFLPWQPIKVSPIGGAAFTGRILPVISSEVLWIWLPCAAILILASLIKGKHGNAD